MVFIFLWILASLICEYRINRSLEFIVLQFLVLPAFFSGLGFTEKAWRVMVLRGSEVSRLKVLCLAMGVDIRRRLFLIFLCGNSSWHGKYWSSSKRQEGWV